MTRRGAIHWVDLGGAGGDAPSRRPVLVVQADAYNQSRITTVLVAVITSRTQVSELPGNVFVPAAASGLPKDSAINVAQLVTLDPGLLGESVGELPAHLVSEVSAGLRRVLAV